MCDKFSIAGGLVRTEEPMTWYVSVDGSEYNDGSFSYPWTLQKVLSNPQGAVLPGDAIVLREGRYVVDATFSLTGQQNSPISFKPHNYERVILDGNITLSGAYIDWYDIEFCYSGWENRVGEVGSALAAGTSGGRLINCTIHDFYNFGLWTNFSELYGCLIFNNGMKPAGSPVGHTVYAQNNNSINRKKIKHNILFPSYNYNFHVYSESEPMKGFDLTENVLIGDTCLFGGTKIDDDVVLSGDLGYSTYFVFGWANTQNIKANIQNVYFCNPLSGSFSFVKWSDFTFSNNTIIGNGNFMAWKSPAEVASCIFDNNAYYGDDIHPFVREGVDESFVDWKSATGFDSLSTISETPQSNVVFVRANDYADISKRLGYVAIYNHTLEEFVSVDITPLNLLVGETYKIIQAQNPFLESTSFVYSGNNISIDMRLGERLPQTPTAAPLPLLESTFPNFGIFIIEK